MKTIQIPASTPYEVHIEVGCLPRLGQQLAAIFPPCTAVVVSDENAFPHYGQTVSESMQAAGFSVLTYVLPAGESSKTLDSYGRLLAFLARHHLRRSDFLVALGGGVIGDLTGFAAATYLRGIPYVQVPTTLLAAVDSSVGGKTAVDLPVGKNLVGAFWQPALVWCDPDTLTTLPASVFTDGCAEVIKYGLLGDAAFFHRLGREPIADSPEEVIAHCVAMKRDLVAQDEQDRGVRQLLNLGHTFGHAIEECSGYTLSHGHCVAMGMAIITRSAAAQGLCPPSAVTEVLQLLERYQLPTTAPYPLAQLEHAALSDKKIFGETIHLVVPENVGCCRLRDVPASELRRWLMAGGVQ